MEPELYYAKKEQLVAKIDSLIRELAQLQQTGQKERIFVVTDLLEESVRELAALTTANASVTAGGNGELLER